METIESGPPLGVTEIQIIASISVVRYLGS